MSMSSSAAGAGETLSDIKTLVMNVKVTDNSGNPIPNQRVKMILDKEKTFHATEKTNKNGEVAMLVAYSGGADWGGGKAIAVTTFDGKELRKSAPIGTQDINLTLEKPPFIQMHKTELAIGGGLVGAVGLAAVSKRR